MTHSGKELGLGVLGLGEGRSIISAGLQSELWDVVWVCDLKEDLCRARCAEFGLTRYTTSFDEMLADPAVDVIGIYTPDHLHAEHTQGAARGQARHLHKAISRPVGSGA